MDKKRWLYKNSSLPELTSNYVYVLQEIYVKINNW